MMAEIPSPDAVRAARKSLGMTQTNAAAVVYKKLRTWQDWEKGVAPMDAALWELFRIKTGKMALETLKKT
jgi:DNA-binding transcriptional regulator YiaG